MYDDDPIITMAEKNYNEATPFSSCYQVNTLEYFTVRWVQGRLHLRPTVAGLAPAVLWPRKDFSGFRSRKIYNNHEVLQYDTFVSLKTTWMFFLFLLFLKCISHHWTQLLFNVAKYNGVAKEWSSKVRLLYLMSVIISSVEL